MVNKNPTGTRNQLFSNFQRRTWITPEMVLIYFLKQFAHLVSTFWQVYLLQDSISQWTKMSIIMVKTALAFPCDLKYLPSYEIYNCTGTAKLLSRHKTPKTDLNSIPSHKCLWVGIFMPRWSRPLITTLRHDTCVGRDTTLMTYGRGNIISSHLTGWKHFLGATFQSHITTLLPLRP